MMEQLAFNFLAKPAPVRKALTAKQQLARKAAAEKARQDAHWAQRREQDRHEARAYWKVGMVVSMPLWGEVRDCAHKYTQMMPGVVESIHGDIAQVRMYIGPEYGLWLEDNALHLKVADVPLTELGRYALNEHLVRIVAEGRLEHGDAELAARIRAHRTGGFKGPRP